MMDSNEQFPECPDEAIDIYDIWTDDDVNDLREEIYKQWPQLAKAIVQHCDMITYYITSMKEGYDKQD